MQKDVEADADGQTWWLSLQAQLARADVHPAAFEGPREPSLPPVTVPTRQSSLASSSATFTLPLR